jgi:hypothetical protein
VHAHCPHAGNSILVREHPQHLSLISFIGYDTFSQAALPRARLRGQNVTGKSMVANHFAGSRFLEPLGRTLMGLQLWHKYPRGSSLVRDNLFQCTTDLARGGVGFSPQRRLRAAGADGRLVVVPQQVVPI